MANFFYPSSRTTENELIAADEAELSEFVTTGKTYDLLGLWGGGPSGEKLEIVVYRGGSDVSTGKSAAVKITPSSQYDRNNHLQIVMITGLKAGDTIYGMFGDRPWTAALPVRLLGSSATDLMGAAARAWSAGTPLDDKSFCKFARPYTTISSPKQGAMVELSSKCIGPPLKNVHGLAVHTTAAKSAGSEVRDLFTMVRWGCVNGWSANSASAHFVIHWDGTLVQMVPTAYIANAQSDPGNMHWISVEVDNNGKDKMNGDQMDTVRRLFGWVSGKFGILPRLATATIFPRTPTFDKITQDVCAAGKTKVVTDNVYHAVMSRGLSCHWWLEGNKSSKSHACPGPGMIPQLAEAAKAIS